MEYGDLPGKGTEFKRLGFLSETLELGDDELLAACKRRLTVGVSLMDPTVKNQGARSASWGLRANVRLEVRGSS